MEEMVRGWLVNWKELTWEIVKLSLRVSQQELRCANGSGPPLVIDRFESLKTARVPVLSTNTQCTSICAHADMHWHMISRGSC